MQTNKITIPNEIIQYYEKCIDDARSEDLKEYSKNIKSLHLGFRPGKTPSEHLRSRIKLEIKKSKISKEIEGLLRDATLYQEFFIVLSSKAITNNFNEFANYFGWEVFLGSLLLDERKNIKDLALKYIDDKPNLNKIINQNKTKEDSLREINVVYSRFLNTIKSIYDPISQNPKGIDTEKKAKNITNKSQETEKMIEDSVLVKRLRRALKEQNQLIINSNSRITDLNSKIDTHVENNKNINSKFTELNEKFEVVVSTKVKEIIEKRIYPWLAPSERISALSEKKDLSIISKAERLLEEQADIDLRHNKKSQIRKEILKIGLLIQSIESALLDSIKPHPELKDMLSSLRELSIHLENQLTANSIASKSQRVNDFSIYISNITKVDDLKHIRENIENRMLHENWTNQEQNDIYETLNKKCSSMYSLHINSNKKNEESFYGQISPIYIIQKHILNSINCKFIIDGHNVLFSLKHQIGHLFENNHPKKDARDYLIKKLEKLTLLQPNIECDLWFDSNDESNFSFSSNLRVLFSGGKGANRADMQIYQSISAHNLSTQEKLLVVVSADNEIKKEAKKNMKISMHPLELMQIL